MPEGPELLYLSQICRKYLLNHKLISIKSNSKSKLYLPNNNSLLRDIITRGKLMVLIFDNYYFHIHLGLTGWIVFEDAKYPKYELNFDNLTVYIDDSRRFSKLKILNEKAHKKALDKLGVDIFSDDFTYTFFKSQIETTSKKIVAFIMEQNKFCGIGNYIKNEALYLAKINPYRTCDDLTDSETENLYYSIIFVAYSNCLELIKENKELKLDAKFSRKLNSVNPEVPYKFKVYQQEKDPKGHKIINAEINGRKCFYVKEIQI